MSDKGWHEVTACWQNLYENERHRADLAERQLEAAQADRDLWQHRYEQPWALINQPGFNACTAMPATCRVEGCARNGCQE